MKTMKKVVINVLAFILCAIMLNGSFALIRMPSDIAVMAGVFILLFGIPTVVILTAKILAKR